jgi:hypothetical protein
VPEPDSGTAAASAAGALRQLVRKNWYGKPQGLSRT